MSFILGAPVAVLHDLRGHCVTSERVLPSSNYLQTRGSRSSAYERVSDEGQTVHNAGREVFGAPG